MTVQYDAHLVWALGSIRFEAYSIGGMLLIPDDPWRALIPTLMVQSDVPGSDPVQSTRPPSWFCRRLEDRCRVRHLYTAGHKIDGLTSPPHSLRSVPQHIGMFTKHGHSRKAGSHD